MLLEIEHLEPFLSKLQRMIENYPNEAKAFTDALYDLIHAVFFAGYIRGKDPDFDYNTIFSEIFGKFSTDEWKRVNSFEFEDEDYFIVLGTTALEIAGNLYPIIQRLMAQEPVKGPIGRVVFKVKEEEEE